jgi:hypothetical protein
MTMEIQFEPFEKLARLRRQCTITEKIDGTNAQVYFPEPDGGPMLIGSRNRWITPDDDNYGFARWAVENEASLRLLGPGRHFGEWWGAGIQRRYGQTMKRWSLFNAGRWAAADLPPGIDVVPTLYSGMFSDEAVNESLRRLERDGSVAAPGFMKPEGVVVYLAAARASFKVTLGGDGHKGEAAA